MAMAGQGKPCSDLKIPAIGIGTYELRGEACVRAVASALKIGFRLIDTAAAYRNEALVGEGIRQSGIPRQELFVVVKIAMKTMKSAETLRAGVEASIEQLGIAYADCLLVHWPGCGGLQPGDAAGHRAARRRCWEVMHQLQLEGKTRRIGVSNFLPRHFHELWELDWAEEEEGHVTRNPYLPVVNEIELHPLCRQRETVAHAARYGMTLLQYSPLGKGSPRLREHPALLRLRDTVFPEFSVTDLLIMWGLSQRFVPLVRSQQLEHLRENWEAAADYLNIASGPSSSVSRKAEEAVSSGVEVPAAAAEQQEEARRPRRVLSAAQRDALLHLVQHLGINEEEEADEHFCWDSHTIS